MPGVVHNGAFRHARHGVQRLVSRRISSIWTDCSAAINFNQLMRTPAFSAGAVRHELTDKMNAIPAVTIRPDMLEKQTLFRLASLAPDQGASFLKIMDWVAEKLRATPAEESA
jgi:hypothetical protein